MATYETLLIHDDDFASGGLIRTIQMNRPERRNALNPRMVEELRAAFADVERSSCAVVILTGAGAAFCAGLDLDHLRSLNSSSAEAQREDSARIAGLFRELYDLTKPTIAAVNGAAIAGGSGLATICDFTLAAPEAKFGYTEVRIGFIPAIVASFLRLQLGEKQARDLLLTGRLIDAEEAHRLGLVTRVVPGAELMSEARNLAKTLLQNSPQAMQMVKRLLSANARHQLDAETALAIERNADARATADFKEGVSAFLEKRKPEWPSLKGSGR